MTILEIVQDIMYEIDPDRPVYTIYQSLESEKVANLVVSTYYNIIDGKDWPNLYKSFQLTQSSASTPTHMTFSNSVLDVQYIKYNTRLVTDSRDKYQEIKFLEPKAFMAMLDTRDSSAINVVQITDVTGIYLNIYKDRAPTFYTSFDEKTLIFDAYNADVETFLKTIKTQCYGKIYPTVVVEDGFYLDLPIEAYSLLLNETKSHAYLLLLNTPNPKAEQHAITQRRRMSQEAWKIRNGITYPNYGRQGKK